MFQFRRFPTVHYLIHARLTEYGSAGFPHSDISGSMLICSSPKLFAAYHVLHRLLMPRHSPCALLRLTASELASVPFRFRRSLDASVENFTPLRCSSSPAQTRFAGLCAGFFGLSSRPGINAPSGSNQLLPRFDPVFGLLLEKSNWFSNQNYAGSCLEDLS